MIVVVCTRCGFGKIAGEETARTKCAHCGRTIDLRKAVRHYEGNDAKAARSVLFEINAGMKRGNAAGRRVRQGKATPEPVHARKKTIKSFISEHRCFYVETLAEYLEVGREEAEMRILRLVEEGVLFSPVKGQYCIVR